MVRPYGRTQVPTGSRKFFWVSPSVPPGHSPLVNESLSYVTLFALGITNTKSDGPPQNDPADWARHGPVRTRWRVMPRQTAHSQATRSDMKARRCRRDHRNRLSVLFSFQVSFRLVHAALGFTMTMLRTMTAGVSYRRQCNHCIHKCLEYGREY